MIFDTLLTCLVKQELDGIKNPIASNIYGFITTEAQANLSISWLEKGYIHTQDAPDTSVYEIKQDAKFGILMTLYKSRAISADQKQAVYAKVLDCPESDSKTRLIKYCEAAKDDPDSKAAVWEILTAKNSDLSFYERRSMVNGFYSWDQQDICDPYYDKFYEALASGFEKHHTYKYQQAFLGGLLPRMNIKDEHIVKLLEIKNDVPDTSKSYMNLLQDQLENLLASKKIREFAI